MTYKTRETSSGKVREVSAIVCEFMGTLGNKGGIYDVREKGDVCVGFKENKIELPKLRQFTAEHYPHWETGSFKCCTEIRCFVMVIYVWQESVVIILSQDTNTKRNNHYWGKNTLMQSEIIKAIKTSD